MVNRYFLLYKPREQIFFLMEIIINVSVKVISGSFKYLCYGSKATINILLFQGGVDIRRQNLTILTSKVDPHTKRVNTTLLHIS